MNTFELSKKWFDFAFENNDKVTPTHGILYFFCIDLCNRLGWKKSFGLPTSMAMEAICVKSYKTYKKSLDDLVAWGFIEMVESSRNQYTANIVALVNYTNSTTKALSNSLSKQSPTHCRSKDELIVSIDKHNNLETNKLNNGDEQSDEKKPTPNSSVIFDFEKIKEELKSNQYITKEFVCKTYKASPALYDRLVDIFVGEKDNDLHKPLDEVLRHFKNWVRLNFIKIKKDEQSGSNDVLNQKPKNIIT